MSAGNPFTQQTQYGSELFDDQSNPFDAAATQNYHVYKWSLESPKRQEPYYTFTGLLSGWTAGCCMVFLNHSSTSLGASRTEKSVCAGNCLLAWRTLPGFTAMRFVITCSSGSLYFWWPRHPNWWTIDNETFQKQRELIKLWAHNFANNIQLLRQLNRLHFI